MKKLILKNIRNKINTDIRSNYKKLDNEDFILDTAIFNYKCHINSAQNVLTGKYEKVILCMSIQDEEPFVHFINQNSEGKYIDSSTGWYGKKRYEYYIVREVNANELLEIDNLLLYTKNYYVNKYTNFIIRLFNIFTNDDI